MFGSSRLHDVRVIIHREKTEGEPLRDGDDWLYDETRCQKIKTAANVQPRSSSSDRLAVSQDDGSELPFYTFILQTNTRLEPDDIIQIDKQFYKQVVKPFDDVEGKRNYTMTLLRKM